MGINPRTIPYHKLPKRIRESMRRDFYKVMPQDADVKSPAQQFDESHAKWLELDGGKNDE